MNKLIFIVALLSLNSQAAIQEITETKYVTNPTTRFWGFFGMDAGFAGLSTNGLTEPGKSGYQLGFKGIGSYMTTNWAHDLGLGWMYNRIDGTGLDISSKISTRSLYAELGSRFRLGQRWQVGGVMNALFGTDVSFSQDIGRGNMSVLAGPRITYEMPGLRTMNVRLGTRLMTDLNINHRQIFIAMADVQIGLPLVKGADTVKVVTIRETDPRQDLKLTLDEEKFHFKTNSAQLAEVSELFLRELGKYLKENSANWKRIEIKGHTDARGTVEHNLTLSQKRAQKVQQLLVAGGIAQDRVGNEGLGFARPLDPNNSPQAWATNRRVEMTFFGVENPKDILAQVDVIRAKIVSGRPEVELHDQRFNR